MAFDPSTAKPIAFDPSTAKPIAFDPSTAKPIAFDPSTAKPVVNVPLPAHRNWKPESASQFGKYPTPISPQQDEKTRQAVKSVIGPPLGSAAGGFSHLGGAIALLGMPIAWLSDKINQGLGIGTPDENQNMVGGFVRNAFQGGDELQQQAARENPVTATVGGFVPGIAQYLTPELAAIGKAGDIADYQSQHPNAPYNPTNAAINMGLSAELSKFAPEGNALVKAPLMGAAGAGLPWASYALGESNKPTVGDTALSAALMTALPLVHAGLARGLAGKSPEAPITPVETPRPEAPPPASETPAPSDLIAKLDAMQPKKAPETPPEPPQATQTPEKAPTVEPKENAPQAQAEGIQYETPTPEEQKAGYKAIQIVPDRLGAIQRVGIKADGSSDLLNTAEVVAEDQKAQTQAEAQKLVGTEPKENIPRISAQELVERTQKAGDAERIARAKAAIKAGKEVSVQDARDAGITDAPPGYIERFGRYEPQPEAQPPEQGLLLSTKPDYQGQHGAPDAESGSPLSDLTKNGSYPQDVYSAQGRRYYSAGDENMDAKAHSMILQYKDHPNKDITVYRAVPHTKSPVELIDDLERQKAYILKRGKIPNGVDTALSPSDYYNKISEQIDELRKDGSQESEKHTINEGDWVTPVREYAKNHGESALNGEYKIVSKRVKARDLYTNGDSWLEWGYDPTDRLSTPSIKTEDNANTVPRTPQDILDELKASGKTGRQIADLAGKNGLVEVHPNMVTADLNIHPSMADQAHLAGGVYSTKLDKIKLMSENIPQGNALGVALHEITHGRLKDLMGENEYNRAISDLIDLADKGDPVAKAAMDRIPENTPAKAKGDELLAYTVQEAVDRGAANIHGRIRQIISRLMNALKARIAGTKFYKAAANRGVRLKITPEALAAYARRATEIEHGKRGTVAPSGTRSSEPLYSMPKDLSEEHQKILAHSKAAIDRGAPVGAVHALLKEHGIDPAILGSTGKDRPEQIANPVEPKIDLTDKDYADLVEATKQGFVGKVKSEMKDFDRVWQKYFPRLDTEQKKIFAGVIQRAFSSKEIGEAQLFQRLWDLRGEFAKMGEAGNIAWRDRFQKGDTSLPHAKFVRDVLEKLYHQETDAGATLGYRENYFPDKYENQGNYETWVENDWVKGHAAGFQKEKLFPTISEAMKAGFKPLYPNVMDALMVRVHEDGIIRSRLQVLNDLMRMGHIRPYPRTDEEALAAGIKKGPEEVPFTTKDFGRYLVPAQSLPILDNGLFAHSWWEEDSPMGKIFRGWMRFKNPVIAGRLGASAYHLTHEVLGLRSANGVANAFDAYKRGATKPAIDKFVKSLMLQASSLGETSPHSLIRIRAALAGGHEHLPGLVKSAFPRERLGDMTDEDRTVFKMIVEGGLPIELSREYRSDVAKLMKAAFQDKKVIKGSMLLPFATLRSTQVPIMDWVVPNLKILAYVDGARQILHAHPDLMENEPKRLQLLGELTRNVEKRFGQMSYDRLFWNKRFKEVMQGTFLSFSWNYGFLNQFGGGLKDVGKGVGMLPFEAGRKANPILTNRAAFALSYTTTAMALAGLMHWAFTGKAPSSIKDLVYPVCGKDAQGADIRCTTPYFTRDMGSLYFHTKRNGPISGLANEAINKLSPVLSMIGDQIRNENYYGQEISDPYASMSEQIAQRAKAFADSFVPISVEGAKRGGNFGLAFAGFNPAPKYATEGDTLAAIYDAYDTYVATTKPYPEALQAHAWKNLRELYQSGDKEAFKRQLTDDIKKYKWSSSSVSGFLKGFNEPKGFHIFSELPPSVKRHIFMNVMNDKERVEYWKAFGRSGFKGATSKEAQEILNLHKEAAHG